MRVGSRYLLREVPLITQSMVDHVLADQGDIEDEDDRDNLLHWLFRASDDLEMATAGQLSTAARSKIDRNNRREKIFG